MTGDLIGFLRAQLDEDERVATANESHALWNHLIASVAGTTVATHLRRWDPARVLAEVAAKRAVLDFAESFGSEPTGASRVMDEVLAQLAQPYAGRPGWREEWAA